MKKLFLLFAAVLSATAMHAGIGLAVNGQEISSNTTITVTEVEDNFGDPVMSWSGTAFYSGNVTVYIERALASSEGYEDQLCAGTCASGTAGQLRDTMTFDMGLYMPPVQVYAHYYPESLEVAQTISYRFVGGGDDFVLTVIYDPRATSVPAVAAPRKSRKIIRDGQVIILRDGVEYNALGAKL